MLVKCYDNKMVQSPFNWVIYPLTQPKVTNQQKKVSAKFENFKFWEVTLPQQQAKNLIIWPNQCNYKQVFQGTR